MRRWRGCANLGGDAAAQPTNESGSTPFSAMHRLTLILLAATVLLTSSACVYRANISQGNLLEEDDVEQVAIGMTQSQVRFLLGTPMIDDPFRRDRWDYVYYLKIGRKDASFKRWVSIEFEDGVVAEIRKDQELAPDI